MIENSDKQEVVKQQSTELMTKVQELAIRSDEDMEHANGFLKVIKTLRKQVKDTFGPNTKAAHDAWKSAVKLEKDADGTLVKAEGHVKSLMAEYHAKREKERREEQERLEAEARKKAEDKKIALAEQAEKSGQTEVAEAIIDSPTVVEAQKVEKQKLEGTSISYRYSARITDLRAVCIAIAEGTIVLPALSEKDLDAICSKLQFNKVATALKENMKYPGVEVVKKPVVTSKG